MHAMLLSGKLKERDHLEEPSINNRSKEPNKMDLREIHSDVKDWINQAQVGIQWLTLLNTVMDLRIS
jgi:hypothetical protein